MKTKEKKFEEMTPAEMLALIEEKKNSFEFKLVQIEDKIDEQLETETNVYKFIELQAKKELITQIRQLYRSMKK